MPAYRRKRSLGCEQLERRFAPSSVLFGAGKRASPHDAQAFDATQVEQAAFYLAASAVLSQSASVANVAPVTFDQPAVAAGEAAISKPSSPLTSYGDGTPPFPGAVWQIKFFSMTTTGCKAEWGWVSLKTIDLGDLDTLHSRRVIVKQPADDSDSAGTPSVDPVSPETPSEQSNDADAVGAVPSEEQPAGGDDVAAEDFPPVVDDTLVAGDEVADPVGEDTALPDDTYADDTSWYADDCEDLGPVDSEYADEEFPVVDDGSSENASESDVVECHSDDAVVGADGSSLFNSEMADA